MQFESEWPDHATAGPLCPEHDREALFFERLGGRSRCRVYSRGDEAAADQTAVVARHRRDAMPASEPNNWVRRIATVISLAINLWSGIRHRESRSTKATWETIDDRILRDLGLSRYEIELLTWTGHYWPPDHGRL
jgi:hypothetical protein